ncbi:MAG: HlyC/CorC family transporter [Methanomicrobia archaeon]|nr:HlyC/CorC family transporter [Methanomicrobia archaeon]
MIIIEIVSLVALLFLSALFSSAETAFTHIDLLKVKYLVSTGNKRAKTLEKLKNDPERTLTTILIGNNLVNISASSIATSLAIDFFGSKGIGVAVGVMTFLILVFGEITPKSYAIRKAESLALFVAPLFDFLSKIFYPINIAFNGISNLFLGKNVKNTPTFTEDEIKTLIDVGEEEGMIAEDEKEMITSIFEFGDTRIKEVMIPRVDMICAEAEETLKEVLNKAIKAGCSRLPVYKDTVDNIVGILYVKDLLKYLKDGNFNVSADKIKREAYFIPETKRADDLLREMQKKRVHMAIVISEYGGVMGLVTLEDLLEEIVGEIFDEYDVAEDEIVRIDENTVIVDARLAIDELNEKMSLKLPNESFDTLAGFMMEYLDKVPEEGEEVEYENDKFIIEKMDEKKISKVRIIKSSQ